MGDVLTIGELAEAGVLAFSDGYRTKRSEHGQPGFRILRVADVGDWSIDLDGPDFVSNDYATAMRDKLSAPGDVLLTTKGTVGRVAIYPDGAEQVVYSPQLCYFRVKDESQLHRRFLAYWFKSGEFAHQALHRANNTDMAPYINMRDIRSLSLTLPDITEQRSIAEVLGALDDKIAANDRVAAVSRELARAVYTRSIASTETVSMSSVLTPFLGGTPSRGDDSLWDGSVPWVSAKDITGASNGVIIATTEGISESAAQAKRLRALPTGSVVLTARGTVGEVARLGIPSAINQSCYAFEPGEIPAAALVFVIENASAQAKAMAHGSVFDTITMRTFDHVNVPNLAASQWQEVEAAIAPFLDTSRQAVVESARLAKSRDELLPLLMSGKLRVNDLRDQSRALGGGDGSHESD